MESSETTKQSKNERIEAFLRERHVFRFNTVKSRTEYRTTGGEIFLPVTKFCLNSIRRDLDRTTDINTSADNIRMILESDFAERVNPVQQYFRLLPRVTEVRAIYELAATVTVQNPDHWAEYLMKWLVGVVANALNDVGCQNHVCLVLTGEQGKFKTTWLDDQLKALNKRDENELKNLITTPAVKYRRPYDVYIEEYPHLASFMASVNGNDFLTDPTGSRRFLPFEVVAIDITSAKAINMDEVYSEAVSLFGSGFRYWFNDEEIQELHRQSSAFHVQTIEYEMLIKGFEKPPESSTADDFMTSTDILNYLRAYTSVNLSTNKLGEALHKAGFKRISKRIGNHSQPAWGWIIRKVTPNPFYTM